MGLVSEGIDADRMKPDRSVLRETLRVAVGTLIMVAIMVAVYAVIGRLSPAVAAGGVYTWALTVLNFFTMGLTVQGIASRAAEKARDDAELAAFSKDMENRMRLSRNLRMLGLFGLIVVGLTVFKFEPLPTILPVAFPSVVIRILQIIDIRRESPSKGSEKP